MRTITSAPDHELEQVRRRFELWRKRRKRCSPIPETLWASAVELVREHGLNRTAQALRLDYYALKKRLVSKEGLLCGSPQKATFIEFPLSGAGGSPACTVEMENTRGEKMKIHLAGLGAPELTVLTERFWRSES